MRWWRRLGTGVVVRIPGLVVVLVFLAEVHAAGQLADAEEVGAFDEVGTQGAEVEQTLERLHGADVGVESEAFPHGQEALFGAYAGGGVVVILRVADGGEEDGIGVFAHLIGVFGEGVAHPVDGIRAAGGVFIVDFVSKLFADRGEHVDAHGGDFGADSVTGQYGNFQFHSYCCFNVRYTFFFIRRMRRTHQSARA